MGIQRWDFEGKCSSCDSGYAVEVQTGDGDYVRFSDHDDLVSGLERLAEEARDNALNAESEIRGLRAELAAKSKDAERYRWLRDPESAVAMVMDRVSGYVPYDEGTRTGGYHTYEYRAGDDLDAAIDSAMGEANGR